MVFTTVLCFFIWQKLPDSFVLNLFLFLISANSVLDFCSSGNVSHSSVCPHFTWVISFSIFFFLASETTMRMQVSLVNTVPFSLLTQKIVGLNSVTADFQHAKVAKWVPDTSVLRENSLQKIKQRISTYSICQITPACMAISECREKKQDILWEILSGSSAYESKNLIKKTKKSPLLHLTSDISQNSCNSGTSWTITMASES